jgi:hypothetical protein
MSVDGDQSALAATLVLAASPYFSPPFSAIAPKRRIGTPHCAALLYSGAPDRRTSTCVSLRTVVRYVGQGFGLSKCHSALTLI